MNKTDFTKIVEQEPHNIDRIYSEEVDKGFEYSHVAIVLKYKTESLEDSKTLWLKVHRNGLKNPKVAVSIEKYNRWLEEIKMRHGCR